MRSDMYTRLAHVGLPGRDLARGDPHISERGYIPWSELEDASRRTALQQRSKYRTWCPDPSESDRSNAIARLDTTGGFYNNSTGVAQLYSADTGGRGRGQAM